MSHIDRNFQDRDPVLKGCAFLVACTLLTWRFDNLVMNMVDDYRSMHDAEDLVDHLYQGRRT